MTDLRGAYDYARHGWILWRERTVGGETRRDYVATVPRRDAPTIQDAIRLTLARERGHDWRLS